jgi:hypothetical protein
MYRVLVQKSEIKKLFGGTMSRREEDTRKYLKCTCWEKVEWFICCRLGTSGVLNEPVPKKCEEFLN